MDNLAQNLSETPFLIRSERAVFGQILYPPGSNFGPRVQQDFQLVLVHEGIARVSIDKIEHRIEAGQVGLLQPGHTEWFQFAPSAPTHHSWCSLAPDIVPSDLKKQLTSCAFCRPISQRLQNFIELGLSLTDAPGPNRDIALQTLAAATMGEYVLMAAPAAATLRLPDVVERTKRLIETDFASDWTLTTLAHHACVTPTYLVTLFHRHLGITPARYLWLVRTREGVQLLRETGLSIAEISHRVGFTSPFHFSRLVKQHYGSSPRKLRAQTWQAL